MDEETKALRWATELNDTRVDVNEAIEAVREVRSNISGSHASEFYECLFVGRVFNKKMLDSTKFERCVFVRCRFASSKRTNLRFTSCHFIGCNFVSEVSAVFDRSFLTDSDFRLLTTNNVMEFRQCELIDTNIWRPRDSKIIITRSSLYDSWISGTSEASVELNCKNSCFSKCSIREIKLVNGSIFDYTAFAETTFVKVDLSDVDRVDAESLITVDAKKSTLHPKSVARPASWPEYDPNSEDDDIPF